MAEKPRLKKSDEILGSLTVEPAQSARAKRAGGRAPEKNDGQSGRGQDAKESNVKDDFFEDDIELTDGPVLPSAQSLAEKLMPKKKPRQRDFSAYEPPKTQAPAAKTPDSKPPAKKSASIEFDAASDTKNKPDSSSVEFHAAPAPAKPPAIEFGTAEAPARALAPPPRQAAFRAPQPPQESHAVQEFEAAPAPTVAEYTFQSFEEPASAENTDTVWEFPARDGEEARRERPKRGSAEPQSQPKPQAQSQSQPRRERIIRPLKQEPPAVPANEPLHGQQQEPFSFEPTREPVPEFAPQPEPQRRQAAPPPAEPEISEAERNRQEFIKRIANQFEVQFEEKFEDGALKTRDNFPASRAETRRESPAPQHEPLFPPREPLSTPEPKRQAQQNAQTPVPPDDQIGGEDFLSYVQRQERERKQKTGDTGERQPLLTDEREQEHLQTGGGDDSVLGFIEKFEKDVREEEHQRSEDFKETLSQKFMRERERYLRELEIDNDAPGPPAPADEQIHTAPQRRRLDFQIQPEMHMQDSDKPRGNLPNGEMPHKTQPAKGMAARQPGPVTYTRGGTARPQTDTDDDSGARGMSVTPGPAFSGKKTGEQLLMEHSMRSRVPAQPTPQPAKLKFTFETPEEQTQKKAKAVGKSVLPTEKWPRRIVLVAMAAGLISLVLVIWSIISYYNLSSGFASDNIPSEALPTVEETIDVYNDRVFTQTATTNNVFFKNAGKLLKNVHVKDYVVIENVEGTGRIRLEDVEVDSAISVKSSGSDTLELHNVKAERVIINNPQTGMTLSVTGNTDIGVIELRTKSTVKQADVGVDFAGIRGMFLTSPESGGEIDAVLDGLNLRTLETDAGTAVLAFSNNTRAEIVSANGSLSLSGNGRISTLSIGSKIGQGAGDLEERKDVVLFVRDVSISSLNVKSPATLNISSTIDSITTSDAITIGGEASIGSLTLNPKANATGRLLIDIVSANVQTIYSNTPSQINVTGSSHLNELTADESTYILGNKVNHLRVNADGVIYESKPDKIDLASGVKPPQSKADNPNIDFSPGAVPQNTADVAGGDFATTCGHSRESGGFLAGDGSKDAPYEVSTAMQLAHAGSHLVSHFIQTNDIDISSESAVAGSFSPIGGAGSPFEGVFDGRGYAISGLKIVSQAENIGLFGANKGTIQNVRLTSGEISAAATSQSFAGGIAGLNYGSGQIRSCSNGVAVNGNQYTITGGVAGGNFGGRIHDCYNYANIAGVDIVGGIVGVNRQGASVTGSYNAGAVDGRDEVGSVAGKNEDGTIANCYFLEETAYSGIGAGSGTATEKTVEELASPQMAADLSAGNESSLWMSGSTSGGYGYPVHRRPE